MLKDKKWGRFLHEVKGVDYHDIDKLLSDEEKMTKNLVRELLEKGLLAARSELNLTQGHVCVGENVYAYRGWNSLKKSLPYLTRG